MSHVKPTELNIKQRATNAQRTYTERIAHHKANYSIHHISSTNTNKATAIKNSSFNNTPRRL